MDQQDLIRRAAEYVGWLIRKERPFPVETFMDEDGVFWYPNQRRPDLHALTGLVEDKVRDTHGGHLRIEYGPEVADGLHYAETSWCGVPTDEGLATAGSRFGYKDPLIARLGALMQLVEKVHGPS